MVNNPWRTLSSRIVYSNPWISVREDNVIRPDGEPGIYGVVETRIATGVVAIEPDLTTYLVGQYRYPTKMYSWEIPEGGTDKDEEPIVAARRELKEEAGIEAVKWRQLGPEFHLSNCYSSEIAVVFLAENLKSVGASPDGNEKIEVKALPFRDVYRMVLSGEIVDAVSIVAITRAASVLREEGRFSF